MFLFYTFYFLLRIFSVSLTFIVITFIKLLKKQFILNNAMKIVFIHIKKIKKTKYLIMTKLVTEKERLIFNIG